MKKRIIIPTAAAVLVLVVFFLVIPLPIPVSLANRMAFSDPEPVTFSGQGTLYACIAEGDTAPAGPDVVILPAPHEAYSGRERTVLVYTPPGFDPQKECPALYLLHGFAARPTFWVQNLIPALETAIADGQLRPMVVIMPDGTVGGNGLDDPGTEIDERGGCWYIDSNLVQYEKFFLEELPGFVGTIAAIDTTPGRTVIAGSSMGGFAAAYYLLRYPERFPNAGLFYPALDLRYAVDGNRLASYDADRYAPVSSDRPRRIVNKAAGGGILGLTEKWCYYPVFDSDSTPGPVWNDDLPVWRRLGGVNPLEILVGAAYDLNGTAPGLTGADVSGAPDAARPDQAAPGNSAGSRAPDLTGCRLFILTGSDDDFNFDDHQQLALPLFRRAGAAVSPDNTNVPGGRHNWETIAPHISEFIEWLRLTEPPSH